MTIIAQAILAILLASAMAAILVAPIGERKLGYVDKKFASEKHGYRRSIV